MNQFSPTLFPPLNGVLRQFVSNLQEILSEAFIGAYLQGSFAVGDYDQYSDVDFIIVTKDELTLGQVDALQELHGWIFSLDCPWAQHLDGSYFPKDILRIPPRSGDQLLYLDNGHSELICSTHCNTLVVRWVMREKGIVLAGPPTTSLVDPVTKDMLREEIRVDMISWGSEILGDPERFNNRFYQSFVVLSYCRMLHDLQAGSVASKLAGAEWAKSNLDPGWRDLIDRTWAARLNPEITIRQPAEPSDFERTLEFVRYAIEFSRNY